MYSTLANIVYFSTKLPKIYAVIKISNRIIYLFSCKFSYTLLKCTHNIIVSLFPDVLALLF